jgi:hypothetical protein
MVELYLHSSMRLHGVELNYLSIGTTLPFTFQGIISNHATVSIYYENEWVLSLVTHYTVTSSFKYTRDSSSVRLPTRDMTQPRP